MKRLAFILAAAALAMAFPLVSAHAETQTETIVSEQRISLSLVVKPEAAQAFLPAGWVPAAAPGRPNLSVIFMNRTLQLDPQGGPLGRGANRLMVLVVGARNAQTGEVRSMVVGGSSTDPSGTPGAYQVYTPGEVTLSQSSKDVIRDGGLETTVEEHWRVRSANGDVVDFDIAYQRGVPTLAPLDVKVYSGRNPEFWRNYRGQSAGETLLSESLNKTTQVSLKAKGGLLGAAIDGTEKIAAITSAPVYARQTYVQ